MENPFKLRPYLSLDIETTGLDTEKSHVLQIGWVIDDGFSPRDQLKRGSVIIKESEIKYGEFFALGMNGWLFQEMSKKNPKYPVKTLGLAFSDLLDAIEQTSELAEAFDKAEGESKPSSKIQLAGKNVSNFDWPIICNNASRLFGTVDGPNHLKRLVDHRFIDVGAVFFEVFGKNPGFDKINKLIGWKDINHDALDDAVNVVVALRYRMGMNF